MRLFILTVAGVLMLNACTYNKNHQESLSITAVDPDTGVKTTYTATSTGEQLKLSLLDDLLSPTAKFLASTEGTISRLAQQSGFAKALESPFVLTNGLLGGLAGNRPINLSIDEQKLALAIVKANQLLLQENSRPHSNGNENTSEEMAPAFSAEEIKLLRLLLVTLKQQNVSEK